MKTTIEQEQVIITSVNDGIFTTYVLYYVEAVGVLDLADEHLKNNGNADFIFKYVRFNEKSETVFNIRVSSNKIGGFITNVKNQVDNIKTAHGVNIAPWSSNVNS